MLFTGHDGKEVSVGEYIDRLTDGAKVELFGGGSATLGQAIAAEIRGFEEECWRLSDAVMLGRRMAEAVIASGDERLPLAMAQKLMEMTKDDAQGALYYGYPNWVS